MIRRALIATLLLAAVSTAAIGVASFRPRENRLDGDLLFRSRKYGTICFSKNGFLLFAHHYCPVCQQYGGNHTPQCEVERRDYDFLYGPPPAETDVRIGGLRWKVTMIPSSRGYSLRLPTWIPVVLFAAYPAITFIRGPFRRYRRSKKGLCLRCGYNLTGNVSGVCSECGMPVLPHTKPPRRHTPTERKQLSGQVSDMLTRKSGWI